MSKQPKNRFAKEIKEALRNNPHIDMEAVKEYQRIDKILEALPPEPEPEPAKPVRLQPIPLRMFGQ